MRPGFSCNQVIKSGVFTCQIAGDASGAGFVIAIHCRDVTEHPVTMIPKGQPIPHIAQPPVQQRCKRVVNRFARHGLKPTLTTFAAVLATGDGDTLITSGTFTQANTCKHQELFANFTALGLQSSLHGFDLELYRAPTETILRRGHTSTEHIDIEPLIQFRQDHAGIKPISAQGIHELHCGLLKRW